MREDIQLTDFFFVRSGKENKVNVKRCIIGQHLLKRFVVHLRFADGFTWADRKCCGTYDKAHLVGLGQESRDEIAKLEKADRARSITVCIARLLTIMFVSAAIYFSPCSLHAARAH